MKETILRGSWQKYPNEFYTTIQVLYDSDRHDTWIGNALRDSKMIKINLMKVNEQIGYFWCHPFSADMGQVSIEGELPCY